MYNGHKIMAIIPARGGSQRVKNKNLRILAGKPLIQYTLEAARGSKYIDLLVVSSDDQNILSFCQGEKTICINRPPELATAEAKTEPVIKHALEEIIGRNFDFDIVILLQPTSPLRTSDHIDQAIAKFFELGVDSLLSCSRISGFIWNDGRPVNYSPQNRPRSQEMSPVWLENGAIYVISVKDFLSNGCRIGEAPYIFEMKESESIEIDHKEDLQKVQMYLGRTRKPDEKQCFIIAEIGNNHQGDIELAKKLIDACYLAGVDAVKSQKRSMDCVKNPDRAYTGNNSFGPTYLEHRKKLELSIDDHLELQAYAERKGLTYFVSVWDIPSAKEIIEKLNPLLLKVPSALLTDRNLLEVICNNIKGSETELILSTGMSTLEEIYNAIDFCTMILVDGCIHLLQCTSTYPCAFNEIALPVIRKYESLAFNEKNLACVGFSGHHRGIAVDMAAVAIGATILERHVTLDKTMKGTDHAASLEPDELKRLVDGIRQVEQALSVEQKIVFPSEIPIKEKLRG